MLKVFVTGRITKDPTLKKIEKDNNIVCNFQIAYTQKDESTIYINCSAWNKQAELLEKYIKKGDQLIIVGDAQLNIYKTDDSIKESLQVTCQTIEFGRKAKSHSEAPQHSEATII